MHESDRRVGPLLTLVLATLPFGAEAPGQVPDGYFIVASANSPTTPGSAGLFSVHPRTPGVVIPVTGLPPALDGSWQSGPGASGPNCVLLRDDESLLVGDIQPPGRPCSVHVLELTGNAVTASSSVQVGTPSAGLAHGGVQQMALLPNGDVLFCVWGLQNTPPLNGAPLGIVSFAGPTPVVTPVPWTAPAGGLANALAVSPAGHAYVGVGFFPAWTSELHHVDFATGAGTMLCSLPEAIMSLTCDLGSSGLSPLLAAVTVNGAPGTNRVFRIDHDVFNGTVSQRQLSTLSSAPNALALERVTGAFAVATSTNNQGNGRNDVAWMTPLGVVTGLTPGTGAGWDSLTGIDVSPNPEVYGAPSPPGLVQIELAVPTGASSLPLVGNTWFAVDALVVAAAPTFYVAGFNRAQPPIPIPGSSAGLLVATPIAVRAISVPTVGGWLGMTGVGIPFPIPNATGLTGLRVDLQVLQLLGAPTVAASNGLEFTVL